MKCTIPGKGIKGENNFMLIYTCNVKFSAFGRAILCLSKIGDELYFEATTDGVRNNFLPLEVEVVFCHSCH